MLRDVNLGRMYDSDSRVRGNADLDRLLGTAFIGSVHVNAVPNRMFGSGG